MAPCTTCGTEHAPKETLHGEKDALACVVALKERIDALEARLPAAPAPSEPAIVAEAPVEPPAEDLPPAEPNPA